jgi:hypothetical protein
LQVAQYLFFAAININVFQLCQTPRFPKGTIPSSETQIEFPYLGGAAGKVGEAYQQRWDRMGLGQGTL